MDVFLGMGDADFEAQCQTVKENQGPHDILRLHFGPNVTQDGVSLLVDALCRNNTVQKLTIVIHPDSFLEISHVEALGQIFVQNKDKTMLMVVGVGSMDGNEHENKNLCDLGGFFETIVQGQFLESVLFHGLRSSQSGSIARAMASYTGCAGEAIAFVIFDCCYFSKKDANATVSFLEKSPEGIRNIGFSRIIFEDPNDKCLIARALARNTSLHALCWLEDNPDKETVEAFCNPLATNDSLLVVEFSVPDNSLPSFADAIAGNTRLRSATIMGTKDGDKELLHACQRRVDHTLAMNTAGRQFLREIVARPNDANIEDFWLETIPTLDNHSVLYSWICDYPGLFICVAGIGVEKEGALLERAAAESETIEEP